MKRDLTATFITTTHHNVGDDLVRAGIEFLLAKRFGPIRFSLIHKHFPVTVREEFTWLHDAGISRVLDRVTGGRARLFSGTLDRLPLRRESDKILSADLLVQSGAPVYWCFPDGSGCHSNEWFQPLINRRYSMIQRSVPFLNIGAGSCQPYESDGTEFMRNSACMTYIRKLSELSTVTTVRDGLAQFVVALVGLDVPLLACPSVFAAERLGIAPRTGEFVALNFMPLGGHYDLHQRVDFRRWKKTFSSFCATLGRLVPVLLVCHNRQEYRAAQELAPGIRKALVSSVNECLSVYSRTLCYIGSRVHGALAAASFGHPAFIVGSDTRARIGAEMMVSSGFVADMSVESLMTEFWRLKSSAGEYQSVSMRARENALSGYMQILDKVAHHLDPSSVVARSTRV